MGKMINQEGNSRQADNENCSSSSKIHGIFCVLITDSQTDGLFSSCFYFKEGPGSTGTQTEH